MNKELTQSRRGSLRRCVAWSLITALLNPAFLLPASLFSMPAQARDTDIYLASNYSGEVAEPAIMLVLDTSESMNIPDAWREYPGAYNSHVEYLWNNVDFIQSIGCNGSCGTVDKFTNASKNASTPLASAGILPQGYFSGTSAADRALLKKTAEDYALATNAGDPGPRKDYRDYGGINNAGTAVQGAKTPWANSNRLYWLPAGTDESDLRLLSKNFNYFHGGRASTPGARGGVDFGSNSEDWGSYNACNASKAALTPSTVYNPSTYAKNDGKWLNQEWMRWERFLNLDNTRVSGFPGTHAFNGIKSGYYDGYLQGRIDNNDWANGDGLPVRLRIDAGNDNLVQVGDSYAGWNHLLQDGGGYHFKDRIRYDFGGDAYNNWANSASTMHEVITRYGGEVSTSIDTVTGWSMGGANLGEAAIFAKRYFPVPGYYDVPDTVVSTGGTSITKSRSCTWTGKLDDNDDAKTYDHSYGGTCDDTSGSDSCNDQVGSCTCSSNDATDCASVTDPASCAFTADPNGDKYWTKDFDGCKWTGRSTLTYADYSGCAWSGRGSFYAEALSKTIYHGGVCKGTCTGPGCPAAVNGGENYCNVTGVTASVTIGSTTYVNYRDDNPNAGCGNKSDEYKYYGGTCASKYRLPPGTAWAPTQDATVCDESSFGDETIGATTYTKVKTGGNINDGCTDRSSSPTPTDTYQDCDDRHGGGCEYHQCLSTTKTGVLGTNNKQPYKRQDSENVFRHDCAADNTATFSIRDSALYPANFGQSYNTSNTTTNNNHSYAASTRAMSAANMHKYDVYHPNYLNWKFGPKGPNGHPIGRQTRLEIAKDALLDLVDNIDGVRFGLMVYNKMPSDATIKANNGSQGGHVAFAIRRMGTDASDPDFANRALLKAKIAGLKATATTPMTEVMYEAYRYFSGLSPVFGTKNNAALGGGNVNDGNDNATAISGGSYRSPIPNNPATGNAAPCQKNYIVLISDGGPDHDIEANADVQLLTQSLSGNTITTRQQTTSEQFEHTYASSTTNCPAGTTPECTTDLAFPSSYAWLDELTYYMANADMSAAVAGVQSVKTYTIGFAEGATDVLKNAAIKGKGSFEIAQDSASLTAALSAVFQKIRDWNPSAASASVPISAFNRSENADEVYLAFFGPTLTSSWNGTVKKYKIGLDSTRCGDIPDPSNLSGPKIPSTFCLTGQKDYGAGLTNVVESEVNPVTSEIESKVKGDAESFWYLVPGGDGANPSRGGSGEMLLQDAALSPKLRKVYTFVAATATDLDLADSSNELKESNGAITKVLLGSAGMSDSQRAALINFARGGNPADANCSDDDSGTDCTSWRSWPHHDVLHSVPAILTYDPNPDSNPATDDALETMYYMSNDGMLHAINSKNGKERWSFMAEEALSKLSELQTNGFGEHLHAGDGSPVLYIYDAPPRNGIIRSSDGDRAYLYFGLRRGGKAYYALDVTDASLPKFKWKITPDMICNSLPCSVGATDYAELGETWSTPSVTRVRASSAPVLIFGAGYNPVVNDQLQLSVNHDGTKVSATSPTPHGYTSGDTVVVSGASPAGYNGTYTITVTGSNTFTYPKVAALLGAASGDVRGLNTTSSAAVGGRGVFVVDATDGTLIRSFTPLTGSAKNQQITGMTYSIPSDALPLNTDLDVSGYVDRLYMGDLGGNLWRFDIDHVTPANWVVTKVADLSGTDTPKRKIMFPPAVVKHTVGGVRYDGIYVGTGDRENPLSTATGDRMFMVKDYRHGNIYSLFDAPCNTAGGYNDCPVVFDSLSTSFYDITANTIQTYSTSTAAEITAAAAAKVALQNADGWILKLEADKDTGGSVVPGEKVVNQPLVFQGILRFGTYNPKGQTTACTPPGVGHQYAFNALDGTYIDINRSGNVSSSDGRIAANFGGRGFDSKSKVLVLKDPVTGNRVVKVIRCLDGICNADDASLGVSKAFWYQEPEN